MHSLGAPVSSVVQPGSCVFGEEWKSAPLLSKESLSHDTRLLRFGLPDNKALGLSTCACILAKGGTNPDGGEALIRPYTPVSTNDLKGSFELIVKVYEGGGLAKHMDSLEIGGQLDFKHISFNVKTQYPFGKKSIGMLVGGTGITPMLQALHAILATPGDTTTVSVLYGNRSQSDILVLETLQNWQEQFPDRLTVTHVLSDEPKASDWSGERGFINKQLVETHMPAPAADTQLWICGPPAMYNALSGPRDEPAVVAGLLAEMGYNAEQVYKF